MSFAQVKERKRKERKIGRKRKERERKDRRKERRRRDGCMEERGDGWTVEIKGGREGGRKKRKGRKEENE